MQISLFRCAACFFSSCRMGNIPNAGRDGSKDWFQMLDGGGRAANHQTVASFQPPNTAAGANVDILDSLRRKLLCTPDVIVSTGIAAVNQNVAGLEIGRNSSNGFVHDRSRNH